MKRKISLGAWFGPAFALLYRMRRLRGTALDACIAALDARNAADIVRVAALPDRGHDLVSRRRGT
jgi:hypothetical protein